MYSVTVDKQGFNSLLIQLNYFRYKEKIFIRKRITWLF